MMPGRRDALILGATGLGALVAGSVVGALALQSGSGAANLLSASFADLTGRQTPIREWQGRVLLCNFWATWCEPCRNEIPLLNAAQQQYLPQGLTIVGIGIDSAEKIREYSAKYGIVYPSLVANADAFVLLRSLGNQSGGLPYSVVLDRKGTMVSRKLGAFLREELHQVLAGTLR
jgi:thiol-disulfide isomerase/thioredoxin